MGKRQDPRPTYALRDGLHTFTFPDQTTLDFTPPRRDRFDRLWAEVTARRGVDQVYTYARIDLLSLRDRQQFHLAAAAVNGQIDWQTRLTMAVRYLTTSNDQPPDGDTDEPPPPPTGPIEPFPIEVFPTPLRRFAHEVAKALPCPVDFIGVPMLAVLGTAIGTTRELAVKQRWREGPRIYSAVVAEPGSKKSPALRFVMKPLYEEQQRFKEGYEEAKKQDDHDLEDYEIREATWKKRLRQGGVPGMKETPKPAKPIQPVMAQVFTTDTTLEALACLLQGNPRSLILVRDELTAWVLSQNQYRGGKGADRQSWLSFWNGAHAMVNRKTQHEPIMLDNPLVCVTGGLPPEVLSDLADERGREDGFIHRILFGFPDRLPIYWTDASVSEQAIDGYRQVCQNLMKLQGNSPTSPTVVSFTRNRKKAFIECANVLYGELADPNLLPNLRGPFAKLEGYGARMALILQLCRSVCGEANGDAVDQHSVLGAAALVHYFQSHARRVYAYLQSTPQDKQVMQALEWIEGQGGQVTARKLQNYHVAGVNTADEARGLLGRLAERGYGTVIEGAKHSTKFDLTTQRDRRQVVAQSDGDGPEASP